MFADVRYPQCFNPGELDHFLAQGWFRMGQSIFTTNFLRFDEVYYSAIWLRIPLPDFVPDKAQQRLIRQNAKFKTVIKTAEIDTKKESLFTKYKTHITFEAATSLQHLLYSDSPINIYNTYEVDLYDGDQLIACGIFDLGDTSAAGITCFYDPDYRKYSLGKYLMLLKIAYCKEIKMEYFYPGYFVPGYPLFDYKLSLSKYTAEYFDVCTDQWYPIQHFSVANTPLKIMHEKLKRISSSLYQQQINYTFYYNAMFDANIMPGLEDNHLFDFPIFLFCNRKSEIDTCLVMVYDVRTQKYHLFLCWSVFMARIDDSSENEYRASLLKIQKELLVFNGSETLSNDMAYFIKKSIEMIGVDTKN